jgi:thymidylate synthase ThyX
MTKQVQKWADRAMYAAEPIVGGPKVVLLSCNNDPLGEIACATMTYEGKFPNSLAEITDEQRRFYFDDVFKARRWAPLEFVNFHFLISGVTRAFTHQMVRQRTAVYAQESIRFSVKEDVPVALPASLAGTMPWYEWLMKAEAELFPTMHGFGSKEPLSPERSALVHQHAERQASQEQLWRREWDEAVGDIASTYNALIDAGMPAEDARGILPTNLQTRIHYNTHLRGLYEHAGNRLCTQAQHEWKVVWVEILKALREYGKTRVYDAYEPENNADKVIHNLPSTWQFEALAKVFKPICYQTGKCEFMSSADRYCAIRDRVQDNAAIRRPSSEWGKPDTDAMEGDIPIEPIHDEEWMNNHAAARISQ